MGMSIVGFGLIFYLKEAWMVISASILLRYLQGFSGNLIRVTSFSIIPIVYPDEQVSQLIKFDFTELINILG